MGLLGSILKIGGGIIGGLIGGPAGAAIGSSLGGAVGGSIEGGASSATSQAAALQVGQVQTEAAKRAERVIGQQITEGRQLLQPFAAQDGVSPAFQLQQAFAGALGPQAQTQAFQQFREDPGVEFLRTQGTEAINRTAAAFGGLGGGNRLKRLSEFNQGLALQSLQNRQAQLSGITATQLSAAGTQAGIGTGLAGGLAGAILQGGAGQAAGLIGAEQARISGQVGLGSILGQAGQTILSNIGGIFNTGGTSAGTSGPLPGGGGSTIFNVPSTGSFVGGFPVNAPVGGLTFNSTIGAGL